MGRRYTWLNNVLPLTKGEAQREPTEVVTHSPSYLSDRLARYQIGVGKWTIGYGEGSAERLQGKKETAQAWLDASSGNLKNFYQILARERKADWRWLGVSFNGTIGSADSRGDFWVGLRFLQCLKFRDGEARGFLANQRLVGQIEFVSSRGLRVPTPSGKGWAIDVAVRHKIGQSGTGLAAVENLWSEIGWKRVRRLSSFIDTAAFAEDPEGFIHDLPFLVGREEVFPHKRRLERHFHLGLGFRDRKVTVGALYSKLFRKGLWNVGVMSEGWGRSRWLISFQFPYPMLILGWEKGNAEMRLGLSHPDPTDALSAFVEVEIGVR